MQWVFRGSIALSWAAVIIVPPLLFYRDRIVEKQNLLQPKYFFDQMEFMKNTVDDNPKSHQVSTVKAGIVNNLFCRLIPISTSHPIFGEIVIKNNKIVSIKREGQPLSNLLISVYEYGYLIEGRDSLGKRIMTLGTFEQNQDVPKITKDIVGRSLVVQNEDRQILAAGIIAVQ